MRTSSRLLCVLTGLALAVAMLAPPATARRERRPDGRTASRAIVYGRDAGVSSRKATSFDVFGRRSRPFVSAPGAAGATSPLLPLPVGAGFDALGDPSSKPSDTTGALGDSFYVAAVNTQLAVYDRNGVQVVAPIQLDLLHANSVGRFVFDPKVIYDQYLDTFLLVYLVQEDSPRLSRILTVAIPNATANDPGTWCAVSFEGDQVPGASAVWADYPGVGFNETHVTITTNQFTFPTTTGRFRYSQVMTIDKGGLYDCNQPAPRPTVFAGTRTQDEKGHQAFTLRPAETVGSTPGPQLLTSFQPVKGKRDYLTIWRIKPTATGFALKRASKRTGKVSFPPLGTQGGGDVNDPDTWWDAGDHRFINAFYDADLDQIFTAHAVFRNLQPDTVTGAYPEVAVRWYEIVPAGTLSNSVVARRGVVGAPEVDVGWPTVATDSTGTLFVTYNRASAPHGEFLSAWVATIPPGSTAETQLLVHAGLSTYNAIQGPERWGDFTAINRDPLDGQNLATFNQYASSSTQWQQFISVVTDT
jgi:hypothetical protein